MTTYRPTLRLAIPDDVTDKDGARHTIEQANRVLATCKYSTRQDAIRQAAAVLSNSGAGACAIPSAEPVPTPRGYQAHSPLAHAIATELGFDPRTGFIRALQRGNRVRIRITIGKPEEIRALHDAAVCAGFVAGPETHYGNGHYFPAYWSREGR